jgi:hypothetical protein
LAGWQSGHAAACKAVYAGSIPTPASNRVYENGGRRHRQRAFERSMFTPQFLQRPITTDAILEHAMEMFAGAVEVEIGQLLEEERDRRSDLERQLAEERSLRVAAEAAAASDKETPNDLGEIEMQILRDEKGRISSPVQITTSGAGNFELAFDRSANGRINRVTIKPRNGARRPNLLHLRYPQN